MLRNIEKLYHLSQQPSRRILGLMSGTSLDGLDIALCTIKGNGRNTKVEVEKFTTYPYDKEFKDEVKKVFSIKEGDIELLVCLHTFIGGLHAKMINETLSAWGISNDEVDLIASHGQTIYHAPAFLHGKKNYNNATLQIGDGDKIAVDTGIITISDFRLKHIAKGGEGAPLAVYGDYLIFSDDNENRVMLNIGGISNYTWLPSKELEISYPSYSSDVGPGNTMIDAFVQKYYDKPFDSDGEIASRGKINEDLVNNLLNHSFFARSIPKTIGPELFNLSYLEEAINKLDSRPTNDDIVATLNLFTAKAIANTIIKNLPINESIIIYGSGGGVHNKQMVAHIREMLPGVIFKHTIELGINPDAKEAVLFALLANECVAGNNLDIGNKISNVPNVSMGKICLPD